MHIWPSFNFLILFPWKPDNGDISPVLLGNIAYGKKWPWIGNMDGLGVTSTWLKAVTSVFSEGCNSYNWAGLLWDPQSSTFELLWEYCSLWVWALQAQAVPEPPSVALISSPLGALLQKERNARCCPLLASCGSNQCPSICNLMYMPESCGPLFHWISADLPMST